MNDHTRPSEHEPGTHTPRPVRGLLIEPDKRIASAWTIDDADAVDSIRSALDCGAFDVVDLDARGRLSLYLDDEGRLSYPNAHGYFGLLNPNTHEPLGDLFAGRGLILARDPARDVHIDLDPGLTLFMVGHVWYPDETPTPEMVEPFMRVIELD